MCIRDSANTYSFVTDFDGLTPRDSTGYALSLIHIYFARKNWKRVLLRGGLAVVSFFAGLLLLLCFGKEQYTPYDLYYTEGSVDMTMNKLGIMTGMRLDVKRDIVGYENEPVGDIDQPDIPEILPPDDPEEPEPIDTSPNIMAIDFDRLIREEQDERCV